MCALVRNDTYFGMQPVIRFSLYHLRNEKITFPTAWSDTEWARRKTTTQIKHTACPPALPARAGQGKNEYTNLAHDLAAALRTNEGFDPTHTERHRAVPKGRAITDHGRHDLAPGLARELHTNLTICHFFSSQLIGIIKTNDSIKCLFHFPLLFFVAEYPLPGSGYFVCPQGGRPSRA